MKCLKLNNSQEKKILQDLNYLRKLALTMQKFFLRKLIPFILFDFHICLSELNFRLFLSFGQNIQFSWKRTNGKAWMDTISFFIFLYLFPCKGCKISQFLTFDHLDRNPRKRTKWQDFDFVAIGVSWCFEWFIVTCFL